MQDRGMIRNRENKRQIIAFEGLKYGTITPTDIDGIIEYKNYGYIIYEIKFADSEVPAGQNTCIFRMINDFKNAGKKAVGIVASHYVNSSESDVIMADCQIREMISSEQEYMKWTKPSKKITVQEFTDKIIKKWNGEIKNE